MSELIRVAGGPTTTGDVIFVHGLDGDARETWQAGDAKTFWPAWLADDFPQLNVWTLDYDAHALNWSGASMPLTDRAANVLHLLELQVQAGRPVCFVCHSLGGLVVKQVIRRAVDGRHRLAAQTRGVVFLGTPHAGSQKATWLGNLGRLIGASVSAVDLAAHSAPLRDLNVWYRDAAPSLGIRNQTYYETRAAKGLKIVDETSADPGLTGSAPIALDADHISIAKATSRTDQMFLGVVQFLRECFGNPAEAVSPLKIRFQVKALDGRAAVGVGGVQGALPGGAKFRLQLANTGSAPVVVDGIRLRSRFTILPASAAPQVDAAAMRFGNARVPHELHLELRGSSWRGRWIIQMQNGTSAIRPIADALDNLLDTDPPTEFDITPGSTESITGSFSTAEPGLYEVSFDIGSIIAGTATAPAVTDSVTLVHFNSAGGPERG